MQTLQNKKAVITGGSRGIGKAIAAEFLRQGAQVFLLARDTGELAATQQELSALGTLTTATVDVSSPEDVKAAAAKVAAAFGSVDILVNAAAIYGPIGLVTEVDPQEWKKALEIILYGTFLSVHFIAPLMQKKGGTIINFVGGGEGPFPHFTSYASAKGGIARFSESVAEEFKQYDIAVNAIAPGAVNTKLLEEVLAAGPAKAGKDFYERSVTQKASGGVPPEKAAALCVFLASEAARGITGKVLSAVWDPYTALPEHLADLKGTDVYTIRRVRPEWRGFDWGDAPQG